MRKNVTKIMLIGLAVATVFALGACSKYKGFKKDKSGFYYQFHGDIHDTAGQPEVGGYVAMLMSMHAGDSTLIPMTPNQMLVDSVYEGDIFQAIRMMHAGDSATFILDGPMFYEKMMDGKEYPFGEEPIYFDIKLLQVVSKAEIEKAQAEYQAQLDARQELEKTEIEKYLSENPGLKQQPIGVYVKSVKKGTGDKVEPLQTVKVHYTGRFVDGTVFDSSVERGEPFKFTVGAGQVIPGWDATVADMKVGDKVTVLIPSDLAYGDGSTTYGSIPPYSPLVFDIELLEIVKE